MHWTTAKAWSSLIALSDGLTGTAWINDCCYFQNRLNCGFLQDWDCWVGCPKKKILKLFFIKRELIHCSQMQWRMVGGNDNVPFNSPFQDRLFGRGLCLSIIEYKPINFFFNIMQPYATMLIYNLIKSFTTFLKSWIELYFIFIDN